MSSFYDLASLVMIPSGKKAGKVYSQKPLTTDGQLDFTRASTATRIGSDGNIEKTRTNLVTQSNQFDTTWTSTAATLTSGQSGYDGTNDAWKLESNATGVTRITNVVTGGTLINFSVYAKAGNVDFLKMTVAISGTNGIITWDLTNGDKFSDNSIASNFESVGGGWYRISATFSLSSSAIEVRLEARSTSGSDSTVSGEFVYIQDAQLEQGLVATNYIETTTAAVSVGSVDNMPRLNYTPGSATSCPSLLLEPQRTNLIPHSEYFQDSGWQMFRAVLTVNNAISPDGTLNAYKLTEDAQTGSHMFRKQTLTVQDGVFYTGSIFAKKAELTSITLNSNSQSRWAAGATFDLSNGTVTSGTGQIVNYGNDWYRCSITGEGIVDTGQAGVEFLTSTGVGQNGKGIFVYGAQFEEGSYATSYIPTFGATVTRNGDSTVSNSTSLGYGNVGTFFLEMKRKGISTGESGAGMLLSTSSGTEQIRLHFDAPSAFVRWRDYNNSYATIGDYIAVSTNVSFKTILVSNGTTVKVFVNGSQAGGDYTIVSSFDIQKISTNALGWAIDKVVFFQTALTDAQCIELTTIDS